MNGRRSLEACADGLPGMAARAGKDKKFGVDLRTEGDPFPVSTRRVCDGILEAVGDTPLVRLRRYLPTASFQSFAKLEGLNPGGSLKDRPAVQIIEHALRTGAIRPGSVVIESSSGNMGIGLAQACRFHGLRFICVVDPKTTKANLGVLRTYGAEIDLVLEPEPESGEFPPSPDQARPGATRYDRGIFLAEPVRECPQPEVPLPVHHARDRDSPGWESRLLVRGDEHLRHLEWL